MMRTYYNGYNFVPRGHVVVYNPTLCLYFFKQFQKRCAYPNDMLDANLAVDDSKLEYTVNLPPAELYSLSVVKHALEEGTAQVMDYGHRLADRYRDLRLKKFVVTALGFERICFLNADDLEG